jgi:DNA-binding CsgD family transcriptional regulator
VPIDRAAMAAIATVLAPFRPRVAAALANIGMLANSGISARQMARALPAIITEAVPIDALGVFWSSAEGMMTDGWSELPSLLSSATLRSSADYRATRQYGWPTFGENVLAGPIAGMLPPRQDEEFYASAFYAGSFGAGGMHHILDAVVHDGARPWGCYLLMRGAEAGRFDAAEITTAAAIGRLSIPAFLQADAPRPATRRFAGGVISSSADGSIAFRNLAAHQSLWMLARDNDRPLSDQGDDSFEDLYGRFCAEGAARAMKTGSHREEYGNRWGAFVLNYARSGDGGVIVTIDQMLPFVCHLATRIAGLDLSPRRVMVCWLLVLGHSRKDIAHLLDVGIDTVNEHISALYARFDAGSAVDLVRAFSD